jgi:hypothetical protein
MQECKSARVQECKMQECKMQECKMQECRKQEAGGGPAICSLRLATCDLRPEE